MNLEPLILRELRVAVRRPSSYRVRMAVGAGAVCVSLWAMLVWSGWTAGATLGLTILRALATTGFVGALVAGVMLTADCLSRESREATLGLLVLTGLNARELVFGKLAGKLVAPLYALMGMLPGFAISSVVGGVTGGEFWRLLLVLANTLFFALAAGLLTSSLCEQARTAYSSALLIILLSAAGIPALGLGLATRAGNPVWSDLAALLSPTGSFGLAFDPSYAQAALWFWSSVVSTNFAAWLCAGLACRFVARRWRLEFQSNDLKRLTRPVREDALGAPAFGVAPVSPEIVAARANPPHRNPNLNPLSDFWLRLCPVAPYRLPAPRLRQAGRFAIGRALTSSKVLELVRRLRNAIPRYGRLQICATLNACTPDQLPEPPQSPDAIGVPLGSNPIAWLAERRRNQARLIWILPLAAAALWIGREVNPLGNTGNQISFVVWFVIHLIFQFWLAGDAAHAFASDRRSGALELLLGTPLQVREIAAGIEQTFKRRFLWPTLALSLVDALLAFRLLASGQGVAALMIGGGTAMFLFYCGCVCRVGLWRGLVSMHSAIATLGTVWRILFLPWVLAGMVGILFAQSDAAELTIAWSILTVVNNLVFVRGAKQNLEEHFRVMALRPYGEKPPHLESEWSAIDWESIPKPIETELPATLPEYVFVKDREL